MSRLIREDMNRQCFTTNVYTVPIRLTHTPTTCSVAVIENSGTSDLEGIVEFECRIIHK